MVFNEVEGSKVNPPQLSITPSNQFKITKTDKQTDRQMDGKTGRRITGNAYRQMYK